MDIGLLWFDDDPKRSLTQKIVAAATRYREKFGAIPNMCYVNPSTLGNGPKTVGIVQIRTAVNILPNHFFIGVADEEYEHAHRGS